MKLFNRYSFMTLAVGFAFTACTNSYDWAPGEQEGEGVVGAYFSAVNPTEMEVDLADGNEFDLTISRTNAAGSCSMAIEVVENEDNIFEVPSLIEFADGETEATFKVKFNGADYSKSYKLALAVSSEYLSLYKKIEGTIDYTLTFSLKWPDAGRGYYLDGTISTFFGVDPSIPLAVDLQSVTVGETTYYRFECPFSHVATDMDGIGYVGYPYNQEGQCDEQKRYITLAMTPQGVSMAPVATGMDWGYGEFSIGSIYGYLSSNIAAYPLGIYYEAAECIAFPPGSLFISMADYQGGGQFPVSSPSFLFLSADAYMQFANSAAK